MAMADFLLEDGIDNVVFVFAVRSRLLDQYNVASLTLIIRVVHLHLLDLIIIFVVFLMEDSRLDNTHECFGLLLPKHLSFEWLVALKLTGNHLVELGLEYFAFFR